MNDISIAIVLFLIVLSGFVVLMYAALVAAGNAEEYEMYWFNKYKEAKNDNNQNNKLNNGIDNETDS